jgi:hypothetical protein
MASVTALIRADKAATMMWLLNTMADAARGLADDGRDAGQRRADALTDIVDTLASTGVVDLRPSLTTTTDPGGSQAGSGASSSPRLVPGRQRVCLNIFVAASTLAGADDLPAELSGQGVITSDLARTIAASATSVRTILVQPDRGRTSPDSSHPCEHEGCTGSRVCGTTLDRAREVYRPPTATDDHVRARDRTCRFPGCRLPAAHCDLDHRIPFDAGGPTCPCNLQTLCRTHHLGKTFLGWATAADPCSTIVWTSPLGRIYHDPPDDPPF